MIKAQQIFIFHITPMRAAHMGAILRDRSFGGRVELTIEGECLLYNVEPHFDLDMGSMWVKWNDHGVLIKRSAIKRGLPKYREVCKP